MLTAYTAKSQDTTTKPARNSVTLSLSKVIPVTLSLSKGATGHTMPRELRQAQLDSLDTRPISFPFWMVQAIALDLVEKDRLELEVELLVLEKETWKRLVTGLEHKDQNRQLQMELLEKNQRLLKVQLQAERDNEKGEGWVIWALRLLGALGAGFTLGRI